MPIQLNTCKCGSRAKIYADPGVGYETHCTNKKCRYMVGTFSKKYYAADAWNRGDQYLEEDEEIQSILQR